MFDAPNVGRGRGEQPVRQHESGLQGTTISGVKPLDVTDRRSTACENRTRGPVSVRRGATNTRYTYWKSCDIRPSQRLQHAARWTPCPPSGFQIAYTTCEGGPRRFTRSILLNPPPVPPTGYSSKSGPLPMRYVLRPQVTSEVSSNPYRQLSRGEGTVMPHAVSSPGAAIRYLSMPNGTVSTVGGAVATL